MERVGQFLSSTQRDRMQLDATEKTIPTGRWEKRREKDEVVSENLINLDVYHICVAARRGVEPLFSG